MTIGVDPLYGAISLDGVGYRIVIGGNASEGDVGLTYETNRYNTAGKLTAHILTDFEISKGLEVAVTVRGQTLFTGTIRRAEQKQGRLKRIEAYDSIAELKRTTISGQYKKTPISFFVNAGLNKAGIKNREVDLPKTFISQSFDEKRLDKVINHITLLGDAAWFVDETNKLVVTQNITNYQNNYELRYIKDASPGKTTPAYQSVKILGSSPVSRKGEKSYPLLSSFPIVSEAGTEPPTFEYKDNTIQTQKQADNAANALYKRLQRQAKGGWVEIVGRAEIRPFDTVTFPEEYGSETYLVDDVKHTINNNGFTTRLQLGGVIE